MATKTALESLLQPLNTERKLSDLLPYIGMVDQNTVLMENGSLFQVVAIEGINPDGLGDNQKRVNLASRIKSLKLVSAPDRAVHHYVIKRRVSHSSTESLNDSDYSRQLSNDYQRELLSEEFVINHYIVIFARPPVDRTMRLADFAVSSSKKLASDRAVNQQKLKALKNDVRRFMGSLVPYKPRLLSDYTVDSQRCSEVLSFLFYLINHRHRDFPCGTGLLKEALPCSRISFPKGSPMVISNGPVDKTLSAIRSIKEFDNTITDGCLDRVLSLPFELIVSNSFVFFTRDYATKKVQLQQTYLEQSEDLSASQQEDLVDALDELTAGEISFGESSLLVQTFANSNDELAIQLRDIESTLDSAGFVSVADDIAIEPNYFSTLPGNWRFRTRKWEGLTSKNYAAISSFHGPAVSGSNNYWNPQQPTATFLTTLGTHFPFNFHLDDLGNTVIVGQSGGGKTVLLSFLASAAYSSGARFVIFDKDQGARIFVEALGGNYTTITEGNPTGFNPFVDLPASKESISFIAGLIQTMVEQSGVIFQPDDYETIFSTVSDVYQDAPAARRLATVKDLLPRGENSYLHDALSRWTGDGQYSWLFDSPTSDIPFYKHDINGIDLTSILDNKELLGHFVRYVFHLTENHLLDGRPFLVCADEGWRMLDTPEAEAKLKNLAKVIRKLEGVFLFASNNPADLSRTAGGKEIIAQSPTKIFVPNPGGSAEDYRDYDLTRDELALVLSQRKGQRSFVLKQDETIQLLNFDISKLPQHIAVLSTRKSTLPAMTRLQDDYGDNWLTNFLNEQG